MTETAARSTTSPKKGAGMSISRVFSTEGVHPYDELTWERRDVVQTNWKTGETVFEQKGVEFPDFWSINASTIVTTKYFRGAVGTDVREWSLKQLVDRVVKTYRKAGEEFGYFAAATDAAVFEEELTWLLVNQYFSFNSPVWFNVGTPSPQQVSACFILAVDDSMDSILNWYKEEGFIFKGGSGAGLNLSRIRSSKELLSSGDVYKRQVQGGGLHLQGRLRSRSEPLAHPLEQGTALLGWHRLRAGVVHAWRRRVRRHDQVRWCDSPRRQDGRPGYRPP